MQHWKGLSFNTSNNIFQEESAESKKLAFFFFSHHWQTLIAGCEVKFLFCTFCLKAEKFGSFIILQMNLILHKLIPQRYHFTIAMQNIPPKMIKCGCLKNKDISLAELGQTAFHCAAAQHKGDRMIIYKNY